MATLIKSDYLLSFQAVGRGVNLRESDNGIVVDAGWDCESSISGAVMLRIGKPLKSVKLVGEFRGFAETRWETMTKLATKPEGPTYKVTRFGKVFQQIVEVIYDSKHPLSSNENGSFTSLPFKFKLPKKNMPPSFEVNGGSIQYYIKFSMLFQEGMKLLRTNHEFEVPVIVYMPESAKLKMIKSPSQFTQDVLASEDKVGYTLDIPKRVVTVGETLQVNLTITKTPGDAKLRMVYATVRPVVVCHNADGIAGQVTFPRPLSEMTQMFPLVKVESGEVVGRKLFLLIDPALAQCSFESNIISAKTAFRLQIVLDNSETPNISVEVPIVVIPNLSGAPSLEGSQPGTPQLNASNTSMRSSEDRDQLLRHEHLSFLNALQPSAANSPQMYRDNSIGSNYNPVTSPSGFSRLPEPRIPAHSSAQNSHQPHQSPPENGQYYGQPVLSRNDTMNSFSSSRMTDNALYRQDSNNSNFNLYRHNQQQNAAAQMQLQQQQQQQQEQYQRYRSGNAHPTNSPQLSMSPKQYPQLVSPSIASTAGSGKISSIQDDLNSFLNELGVEDHTPLPATPAYSPMPNDKPQSQQQEWGKRAPPTAARVPPRASSFAEQPYAPQVDYSALSMPTPPPNHAHPDWDAQSMRTSQSGVDTHSIVSGPTGGVEEWTVAVVGDWLTKIGASPEVVKSFAEQEIDGSILVTLSADDLKSELGVSALGIRRKIVLAIERLRG
ncbi:hypothetical protein HDU78_005889 [Chytriomyces hyalinus]|nr:hypothetical protein HDU78_005889 [Chytriomyces hyalinus]